jgi:thiol-disulfide isomerase/thioredoxin
MRAIISILILVLVMSQTTSAVVQDLAGEFERTEVKIGRTVLVEERTAIWCPSCAQIDPELAAVAQSHGSRAALVALHTSDAFENNASRARMQYQNLSDSRSYGTPTFFVDHQMSAEGFDAWPDVQRRILSQESTREKPEDIFIEVNSDQFGIHVDFDRPSHGQLTLLFLEHDRVVPEGSDNPGEETRDRVLVMMAVIFPGTNSTLYHSNSSFDDGYTLSWDAGDLTWQDPSATSWSIIAVHEPVDGGEPYGVVEIAYREIIGTLAGDNYLAIIFGVSILLGALMVFTPIRGKDEEE